MKKFEHQMRDGTKSRYGSLITRDGIKTLRTMPLMMSSHPKTRWELFYDSKG